MKEIIYNDDIDDIIANAIMFDGKPLTDDDKRAIRGIIAGYMSSKRDWGIYGLHEFRW